jgi:preprotein translocase subunit SecE
VSKNVPTTGGTTGTGDLTRWVHLMFLVGGLMSAYILFRTSNAIWFLVGEPNDWILYAASIAASAVTAYVLWRNERVNTLAFEVVQELSRVTWPTRKELTAAIIAVIVVSIIVSIILGLFDMLWGWTTNLIYFGSFKK